MPLSWISLAALMIAVTLSMFTKMNVGVISIAFAWIVGVYLGGMPLNQVIGAFPVNLFLTLVGVTLLFGMAHVNGTLERLAARAVALCYGNAGVIPLMFFVVAVGLSTIGPGNIATTALLAPMAMAIGHRALVPPFLMILMVGNGAQAGALSPFAPTGVIVNGVMERIGLDGVEWQTYANNLLARISSPATVTAVIAFVTGVVSAYSSTSGVVLPAFLPMAPDLAQRLGGIDPLSIAWSMNVSASLVDLSSLSTVGALYIAGAAPGSDVRKLFNGLLVWGLSMCIVGALLCWILFG